MGPSTPKQVLEKKYGFGPELLEELLRSGTTLVTGPFYYTLFLLKQIHWYLDEKIVQSGEDPSLFTDTPTDFSSLGLPEYCIDLSLFEALHAYDKSEMEQWEKSGFDSQELLRLRDEYLYGDVWSKEDEKFENAQYYDRIFTVIIIDSLSLQLTNVIDNIAKKYSLPLLSVISIFKGLLFYEHKKIKLMVLDSSKLDHIQHSYLNIATEIHCYWEEVISLMSLMLIDEYIWVLLCFCGCKEDLSSSLRSFLLKSSYHHCIENSMRCLSDIELVKYMNQRYIPIQDSYNLLKLDIEKYLKLHGKGISVKTGRERIEEEEELGERIYGKFIKIFLKNYRLYGNANNIAKYMKRIYYRLGTNIINDIFAEKRKHSGKMSRRTERRYEYEFYEELKLKLKEEGYHKTEDEIKNEFYAYKETEKQKAMVHTLEGFFTRSKLIEIVFMDTESTWYYDLFNQGIVIPEMAERTFKSRLKKLESSGKLIPDAMGIKTRAKYYRKSLKRIREIGKLVASEGRKRKQ